MPKKYEQNEKFFSRYSSYNSSGNIQSNSLVDFVQSDIIDTVMNILKEKDLKYQFVDKIVNKYGYAKWNESLIVNNINKLKTVLVPISDTSGKTSGLILVYQITKEKAAFKVINRSTKQSKLKENGDINAHLFTQKSLEGIFESFDKIKAANSSTLATIVKKSEGLRVSYRCWYYTSTAANGDFLISNTQCSFSLVFTPDVYVNIQEDESLSSDNVGFGGETVAIGSLNEIKDSLNNKCLKSITSQIMSSSSYIYNDITLILKNIFSINDKINLVFRENPNLVNRTGVPIEANTINYFDSLTNMNNFTITLNPTLLDSTSQEFKTAVIIHEIIHAGIRYSYNNQGYPFDIFNQTITHQDMLSKYMEEMSTALVAYFPNMTMNQARSLSLFGLGSEVQSSPQFANYIALYGFNANGGTDDWSEYALKYKVADNFGTKCNNQ